MGTSRSNPFQGTEKLGKTVKINLIGALEDSQNFRATKQTLSQGKGTDVG